MLIPILTATMLMAAAEAATTPQQREGWHAQRHALLNQRVANRRGQVDLVFIGDSITQAWETDGAAVWEACYGDRHAINLGISGDRTEHVLWRLSHGNLDGIRPRVAVVMIGTNNIGHGTHDTTEVLAGVTRVVDRIIEESPETRVLLLDIFPRGASFNADRGRIAQINQTLRKRHDGQSVVFLPIGHVFIEQDGSISKDVMPDGLHLSEEGYRRWAAAMEPTLREMLSVDSTGTSP